MQKEFEKQYHLMEEENWWCRARRELILHLLEGAPKTSSILEIGCSTGLLMEAFMRAGFQHLTGIDVSPAAIEQCRLRQAGTALVMNGSHTSFTNRNFDVIVASDVLEHLADDAEALAEWARLLKPGGKLVVFVPAFQFLWGPHDVRNLHRRRYSYTALNNVLRTSGFRILRLSYWNSMLLPAALLAALARKARPSSHEAELEDPFKLSPWLNSILYGMLHFENHLLQTINLHAGVSLFALAENP